MEKPEFDDLCAHCWGSGESQHSPDHQCSFCKGSGIDRGNVCCANCDTEADPDSVFGIGLNFFCSDECYDEHCEKWG